MSWFQKLFRNRGADADAQAAPDAWLDRYLETLNTIRAMPLEEARRQAELLLADPQKFDCYSSPLTRPLDMLAPELQALFSRFNYIGTVDDEAFLSRESIEPWDVRGWSQRFWYIGDTHGHSNTLVKPHDEAVYMTGEAEEEAPSEPLPSIHHWLLWVSACAVGFGDD